MVRYNQIENAEFFAVLRVRIQHYFKSNELSIYAEDVAYAKAIVLIGAYALTYYTLLHTSAFDLYLILCVVLGMLKIFIALNIAHDAAHRAFFRNRRLNDLMLFTFDALGANGYMWKLRHVHSHHAFTNVPDHDADIKQSALVRIFPNSPLSGLHSYQHLYMPVLYGFYSLHWLLFRDFKDFINTPPNNHLTYHRKVELIRLILGKLIYFTMMILVPYQLLALEFYQVILGFMVMQMSASYTVAIALASAHVGEHAEFPEPDRTGQLPYSFLMHQLITTTDFATDSKLLTHLYGGFNHHVIHHLFPNICHIHYPPLTKILKNTCKEYGIGYNENKTLIDAINAHLQLLKSRSKNNLTVAMPEF
ncbi:MAG: acyl-CoA desaturase [Methylococcales bacterium]|nr:acyl-CoA desaturase [Methylococcales bacterium]